jgi:beta-glucanase (GH16 family)
MRRIGLLTALILALTLSVPAGTDQASASGTHSITLYSNIPQVSAKVIKTKYHSYKLPRVSFVRPGFSFVGWAKTVRGAKAYSDRATIRSNFNVRLYAIWKEIPLTPPVVSGRSVGTLLWREEFRGATGSTLNSNNWTARYCGQEDENGGGTCHNNEPQWYLPSAVALDGSADGNAVITTRRVSSAPPGGICLAWSGCQFTSARFDTQGKLAFKYGYIETRIKMPAGGRNWPAFWMLGENITTVGWPQSGEIDIAEQGGNTPAKNSGAIHYSTNGVANDCCGNHTYDYGFYNGANYSSDFHVYAMAWTPNRIDLIVDGIVFKTFTNTSIRSQYWSFNNPFFLIINNATGDFGGSWTGWTESQMHIDYVRSWKLDNYGEVFVR